jgi:hypothetical protein
MSLNNMKGKKMMLNGRQLEWSFRPLKKINRQIRTSAAGLRPFFRKQRKTGCVERSVGTV